MALAQGWVVREGVHYLVLADLVRMTRKTQRDSWILPGGRTAGGARTAANRIPVAPGTESSIVKQQLCHPMRAGLAAIVAVLVEAIKA